MKLIALLSVVAISASGAIVNKDCPMSGNPIKDGITYTISVCCKKKMRNTCFKKFKGNF